MTGFGQPYGVADQAHRQKIDNTFDAGNHYGNLAYGPAYRNLYY